MSEKYITSPKGNKLPLLNLKGKSYLQGAYRLVWLNEAYENFDISTTAQEITDDHAIFRAVVTLFDTTSGKVIKKATATKKETKKAFHDYIEKAESSAIFRALAMLGMGTQFASAEFEEGDRIADSPVETKQEAPNVSEESAPTSFKTRQRRKVVAEESNGDEL